MEDSMTTWLTETATALSLAKNVTEAQRQISTLEEASASLGQLLEEFRQFASAEAVVRPVGWEGTSPSPDLLSDLREAADTLGARPLARLVRRLAPYKAEVRSALLEHWHRHASERMGNVGDLQTLAGTLNDVEGLSVLSRGLETVLGELARIQREIPSARSAELLREAELRLQVLEQALQPESVRRFLSAVARGGASISLLTKDVLAWLRSHHAVNNFKIVAGEPTNEADA